MLIPLPSLSSVSVQVFDVEYPQVAVSPPLFRNMAQLARARSGMTNTTGQVLSLLKLLVDRRHRDGMVQDYFDIDWDLSSETCSRLFFATGGMVASFKRFAQFFTLDATCKTNRFNMPLVLLVGMDDTKKTTIFGMALVLSESIESYVWVLQCFKKAVGQPHNHPIHAPQLHHYCITILLQ